MQFFVWDDVQDDKASSPIGAIEGMCEFVEDLLFCKMDEILRPKLNLCLSTLNSEEIL